MKKEMTATESMAITLTARIERLERKIAGCETESIAYSKTLDAWIDANIQLDDIFNNWGK